VLDKLTYVGNLANLDPPADQERFTFARGDICDAPPLASVIPGHGAVINFAAETHVDRSIASASDFVTANVAGSRWCCWTPAWRPGPSRGPGPHR